MRGNSIVRLPALQFDPLAGDEFPAAVYAAIVQYELHLRYYVQAQRLFRNFNSAADNDVRLCDPGTNATTRSLTGMKWLCVGTDMDCASAYVAQPVGLTRHISFLAS